MIGRERAIGTVAEIIANRTVHEWARVHVGGRDHVSYRQRKQRGKTGTDGGSAVVGFAENPEKYQNAWTSIDRPLREQKDGEE